MKRVCAWCTKDMGQVESKGHGEEIITHGICEACANKISQNKDKDLRSFFDGLDGPSLAVHN